MNHNTTVGTNVQITTPASPGTATCRLSNSPKMLILILKITRRSVTNRVSNDEPHRALRLVDRLQVWNWLSTSQRIAANGWSCTLSGLSVGGSSDEKRSRGLVHLLCSRMPHNPQAFHHRCQQSLEICVSQTFGNSSDIFDTFSHVLQQQRGDFDCSTNGRVEFGSER